MTKIETKYRLLILGNLLLSGFHGFSYFLLLAFQKNCEFCLVIASPAVFFSLLALIGYFSLKPKIFNNKKWKVILVWMNIIGLIISAYYFIFYFLLPG